MIRPLKIIGSLFALFLLLGRCKENYVSPYVSPPTGYLVVEGYITGNGPTQFMLSRTIPLPGDSAIPEVTGAQLQVEGSDNSVYGLTEQGNGAYGIDTLALNVAAQYRLRITTSDGKAYLSDFVAFKPTPAIDSVNWVQNGTGVQIYVNTHDPANATHYYQWLYDETWEYYSGEESFYKYLSTTDPVSVVPRPLSEQIYRCWRHGNSTSLLLGSSTKLAQDEIYLHPLNLIPSNSQQIDVLYSMLVRQYALTSDAYNYLSLMQKNSESLGSIFDVQPSVLKGNIHSLSNPDEQVVGFVSAGTVQQKRLFVSRYQLGDWSYSFACPMKDTLVPTDPGSLRFFFGNGYIPLDVHYNLFTGQIDGYTSNYAFCIDCRSQGGTTDKPSYWPN